MLAHSIDARRLEGVCRCHARWLPQLNCRPSSSSRGRLGRLFCLLGLLLRPFGRALRLCERRLVRFGRLLAHRLLAHRLVCIVQRHFVQRHFEYLGGGLLLALAAGKRGGGGGSRRVGGSGNLSAFVCLRLCLRLSADLRARCARKSSLLLIGLGRLVLVGLSPLLIEAVPMRGEEFHQLRRLHAWVLFLGQRPSLPHERQVGGVCALSRRLLRLGLGGTTGTALLGGREGGLVRVSSS
mmetsp:Transcript_4312/g.9779  ORF Transcript_4312/g.9779 Transcript_4312/m.9779 type:complete len:239 (+) Transcript_4312:308-1024(+)